MLSSAALPVVQVSAISMPSASHLPSSSIRRMIFASSSAMTTLYFISILPSLSGGAGQG